MDRIIYDIFNKEHVSLVELETPDPNFPDRILGIRCNACGRELHKDSIMMVDHLQHKHKLLIKDILTTIKR